MPGDYYTNNETASPQPSSLGSITYFTIFNRTYYLMNFFKGATGGTGVPEERDTMDLQNQTI
jgi:hypothetical protein